MICESLGAGKSAGNPWDSNHSYWSYVHQLSYRTGANQLWELLGFHGKPLFFSSVLGRCRKPYFFLSIGDGFYVAKNRPIGPSAGDLAHHVR